MYSFLAEKCPLFNFRENKLQKDKYKGDDG